MAGEATEEELAELEGLLRKEPDPHYAIQNITDIWHLPVRPSALEEDALAKHLERMKQMGVDFDEKKKESDPDDSVALSPRRPRRMAWYALAAVLLAGGIFFVYRKVNVPGPAVPLVAQNPSPDRNEITTRNGSRTRITLPDGSRVWLNAGSDLWYDKKFDNEVREVELSGEAYFDVVKNPSHPFIIHTHAIDVKVLGTSFNVKAYPGDPKTETSLIHGKVEVSIRARPEEKFLLKPNEKLVVLDDSVVNRPAATRPVVPANPIVSFGKLTYQAADSVIVETAWVQNKLVFDDESFPEIAAKMERWYGVNFEFRDPNEKRLHLTGSFEHETIQQALDALRITAPFHYILKDNTVIITK